MISALYGNRYILLDDEVKKLEKFIEEEFGISNAYRINGDFKQIDIYVHDIE